MNKIDLTKGKVLSVLTMLAVPIMGSSLLQFTYNLIDMLWVGSLGSDAIASIGSCSFYISLGYSINALAIIGCGIKVAHALGEKNEIKVQRYINSGITLNLFIGIFYGIILILFGKNIIGFLGLNNIKVESQAYNYLIINAPILIISFFNLLYTRILSSYGNNKLSFKINGIGVVINIILDPIFIYVLNFGVVGAAISTLMANIIMILIYRLKAHNILSYDFNVKQDYEKIKEIIILGFPIATQRILFTFINIILAKMIAKYGSDAIAAQKIGLQIESVTYMVIGGLNGAILSFTGQNYGAKKYDRILKGYNSSLCIGLTYSFTMSLLFFIYGPHIVRLFIREEGTLIIAAEYLKIIAFSQVFSAIEMVTNGLFTGIGKPKIPSIISITFTVLRIPMALAFMKYYGLTGVWMSIAASSILKGITAYMVYIIHIRKDYKNVREVKSII